MHVSTSNPRSQALDDLNKAVKNDDTKKLLTALEKAAVPVTYVEESTGHSLMHRAAAFGALKAIKLLHERGASLDVKNKRQLTPLDVAENIGEAKAVKLLKALAAGQSGDGIGASDASDGDESD